MSKVKEMQLIHVQIVAIQYCWNICVSIELIDAIDVSIKSQNQLPGSKFLNRWKENLEKKIAF